MNRSERRYRTAHKKALRVRYCYQYFGPPIAFMLHGELAWYRDQYMEKPWQLDGAWFMHEAPSTWINQMMTRPARREQKRLLLRVTRGANGENLSWPDYRRPFVYYW